MVLTTMAYQRFEENKDNPMVQALRWFIQINLLRSLESVVSWGVEVSDKPERKFYLRFADGMRYSGQLQQIWQVQVFEVEKEKDTHTVSEAIAEETKEWNDKETGR